MNIGNNRTYVPSQDATGKGFWVEMPTAPAEPDNTLQKQIIALQETVSWLERENERQNDELLALCTKVGTIGRRMATVLRHLGMEK